MSFGQLPIGWEPYRRLECPLRAGPCRALFNSASSVLAEVVDFVSRQTKARVIYEADGPPA